VGAGRYCRGAVAEPLDSSELHLEDTVKAGAGLCDQSAVDVLVREGPHRIRQLIARGAHFDTEPVANSSSRAKPLTARDASCTPTAILQAAKYNVALRTAR
jgi:aspartate oxidase